VHGRGTFLVASDHQLKGLAVTVALVDADAVDVVPAAAKKDLHFPS
jgi:hypothetical protein